MSRLALLLTASFWLGFCSQQPAHAADVFAENSEGGGIVLSYTTPCAVAGIPQSQLMNAAFAFAPGERLRGCWFARLGIAYVLWESGDFSRYKIADFKPATATSGKSQPKAPPEGQAKPQSI